MTWVHGTRRCYVHMPCRCRPCTDAHTLAINKYRGGRREREFMPADEVRRHARHLLKARPGDPKTGTLVSEYRWTQRTLGEHIGMGHESLGSFLAGRTKRIEKRFGEAILATHRKIPPANQQDLGRKHVRTLCALVPGHYVNEPNAGDYRWTQKLLAEHLGIDQRRLQSWLRGSERLPNAKVAQLLATPKRKCFLEMEANIAARGVSSAVRKGYVGAAAN